MDSYVTKVISLVFIWQSHSNTQTLHWTALYQLYYLPRGWSIKREHWLVTNYIHVDEISAISQHVKLLNRQIRQADQTMMISICKFFLSGLPTFFPSQHMYVSGNFDYRDQSWRARFKWFLMTKGFSKRKLNLIPLKPLWSRETFLEDNPLTSASSINLKFTKHKNVFFFYFEKIKTWNSNERFRFFSHSH